MSPNTGSSAKRSENSNHAPRLLEIPPSKPRKPLDPEIGRSKAAESIVSLSIQSKDSMIASSSDYIQARLPSAMQKTTFTVLGICCASETRLIDRILKPLQGIENVSVNVLAKSATVIHDPAKVPASQIVEALNKAHLNAGIKEFGNVQIQNQSWPSPSVIASGVLLLIAMFSYVFPPLVWIALISIVVGIFGMFRRAIAALRRFVLDINVLMVTAVFGAIGLGDYLEGASIVFLFTLAEWLEAKSSNKARTSLESLLNLTPQTAVIADTGESVPVKDITIDTIVSVKAGEFVPVDGVVVVGSSTVDESSLTGEFLPVDKEIGSNVWSGTVVLNAGFINVQTKALAEDSAVARMVKLVEEAQNQHSNMEEFIEQFAKYYTPGVFMVAAGTAIVPWMLGVQPLHQWIYLALVLLVIACPCALVISTPVAKACGLSAAAKIGLIFKGGNYLEALAKIKAVAFDKTGTLTEGVFEVVKLHCMDPNTDIKQFLHWISSLENMSSHPMAKALVEYAKLNDVRPSNAVRSFNLIPGGISGYVDDCFIQIGNYELAIHNGWLRENELHDNEEGITISYVGTVDQCIGYFCLGDQVRKDAVQAVQELQKQQIQVVVLTGDSKEAAKVLQKQIGLNVVVEAGLSPEGKMKKIAGIRERWGLTAMVGDGINDALALTESDVGIAMGIAGSALATETANVALMSNDLRKIPEAIELAKASLRKIYQNVAMSLVVKLLFFGLAFGGFPSLWAAVVADMGTCLLVIFNSMQLLQKYGKKKTAPSEVPEELSITIDPGSSSQTKTITPMDLDEFKPLLSSEERDQSEHGCSCCKDCNK
ncbi:cadmium/zinc-transporting ATPase HMA2-like [Canna indica]|uniref:Cd(2+)-exporting ATPase n=1 Tax=Canna indica TaxID=4628 RepID=A0AAQ3JZ31_9LILI|nr:cadmium/zinc-transporting ATPase HMA2-like [Canna indica]